MGEKLTISVVLASFLVVPALCMGGLITHACDCATETACHCGVDGEHESGCEDESGCGHEGDCSDDPCSVQVVRPNRQSDDVVTVSPPAASATIIYIAVKRPSVQTEHAGTHECLGGKNLSLPSGDLPLLI